MKVDRPSAPSHVQRVVHWLNLSRIRTGYKLEKLDPIVTRRRHRINPNQVAKNAGTVWSNNCLGRSKKGVLFLLCKGVSLGIQPRKDDQLLLGTLVINHGLLYLGNHDLLLLRVQHSSVNGILSSSAVKDNPASRGNPRQLLTNPVPKVIVWSLASPH